MPKFDFSWSPAYDQIMVQIKDMSAALEALAEAIETVNAAWNRLPRDGYECLEFIPSEDERHIVERANGQEHDA